MDNAKEFAGKTLDEAIRKACDHFDLPREKLEIDIVSDAKSGIFGLVGTRKAVVRARQAQVSARVGDILGAPLRETRQATEHNAPHSLLVDEETAYEAGAASAGNAEESPPAGDRRRGRGKAEREQSPKPQIGNEADRRPRREPETPPVLSGVLSAASSQADEGDDGGEHDLDKSPVSLESLDQDTLRSVVYDTACRLIRPIVPDAKLGVEIGGSRVAVQIDSDEDLGLLIGREGQTLASIQYLAARIVARKLGALVRIQLDAGDYRERQDGKLRGLALMLAERVKITGRACTTRPLSSYQRRIVHMTLQDDSFVLTRSAGEGPLKRVVIQRARAD
ncbi:MAG: Jag N-terminal domain-containing protein [Deltaproteobacteria bacterium]|jgi:spoIIIJ-associated protein|nr:Jag N-terminal domain-containing protein [Deltaproteobacteria bacterium]